MSERKKPTGFIRKGGRVIPIFSKKKKKDLKQGSLTFAGGVAISATGAGVSGSLAKKFFSLKSKREIILQNAMSSMSDRVNFNSIDSTMNRIGKPRLPSKSIIDALRKTNKQVRKLKKLSFGSKRIFKFSRIGSAALVGLGTEKLLRASGFNDTNLGAEIGSESVGVAAATANELLSSKVFKKKAFGEPIFKGFKRGLKKAGRSLIRRKFKI